MLPSIAMPQNLPRLSTQSGFPSPAGFSFPGLWFKALLKTLRRHFLAPCALVDLLVHPPSSVGAGRSGTLRKVSSGLSASLETLTNSKTQGVLPTPHTGATRGMERPCFWTRRAVLWLRVLYSKYPVIFLSTSKMSAVYP